MSRSSSNDSSTRRYVCPDCDKAFSTSSHLGRHSRVHTGEKNYKCSFPGCETRCSRQDNLQAHQRVHLAQRPKGTKKSGAGKSAANTSPVSSSSSLSPTAHHASPPEMFRSPAPRFSSMPAGNSPQPLMSPQLSPSGTPYGPPMPLYDGFSDRFNTFSIQHSPVAPSQPYPRGMRSPHVRGRPPNVEGYHSSMLFQNAPPLQRRGSIYPPPPPGPPGGPSTYPYATYQQAPASQYPTNIRPSRGTPSPTPSDFRDLSQLPRGY